jgi:hypothetical protein
MDSINKFKITAKEKHMKYLSLKNLGKILMAFCAIYASVITLGQADDNSIYIQQSGNNTVVSMDQEGTGNIVRGIQGIGSDNTTPAKITGDSNTVSVTQIGTGNTLNFGISTLIANGGVFGGNFSYSVTGNNATATIDSNKDGNNTSQSNNVVIDQSGNFANANVNVLGSLNSVTATTSGGNYNSYTGTVNGNNNTQNVSVSQGGNNTVEINQGVGGSAVNNTVLNLGTVGTTAYNYGGTASVTIQGDSNSASVQQSGVNGFTNTTVLNLNGSSNTANVVQSAVGGNTTVNISSYGSSNIFTVTSKNY